MMDPKILLFIIKLVAGGIVAFLAILLMSKTRDGDLDGFINAYLTKSANGELKK